MTELQFKRWRSFAVRMAYRGWPAREVWGRKQHRRVVIPEVRTFFELFAHDHREDLHRIRSWDDTDHDTSITDRNGRHPIGPFVCDIVSQFLEEANPCDPWPDDGERDIWQDWDDLWGGRVRCCIRAGIDMAVEPSAGVIGFTVCDLRRMYPKGIPDWINSGFQDGYGTPVDLNAGNCAVGIWL